MRRFTNLSAIVLLWLCAFRVDAQISSPLGGGVCSSSNILYTVGGYSSGSPAPTNASYRWSIGSPSDAGSFVGPTNESGARVSWDLSKIRDDTYLTVDVTTGSNTQTYNLNIYVAGTPPPADPVSASVSESNSSATITISYTDAASIDDIISMRAVIENTSISTAAVANGLSYTTTLFGRIPVNIYVRNSCGEYGPYTRYVDVKPVCVSGSPTLTGSSIGPVTDVQLGSGSESRTFTFNASNLPRGYEIKQYQWNLYRGATFVRTYTQTSSNRQTVNFANELPGDYTMQLVAALGTDFNDACSSVESVPFPSNVFTVSCDPKTAELSPSWGSQARSEVEITSTAANMAFTFSQEGELPEGVTGPVNGYAWFLEKPDGTRQTFGTLQSQTFNFSSYGLGRYRVIARVSAPTDLCYTLQPEYSYKVDVNPPCPDTAPGLQVPSNLPEIEKNVYRVDNKSSITLQINRNGLTQSQEDYLYAAYQWQATDFPSSGVTISPAMSGSTTRPGNQTFTLKFTKSGKYEFAVRGINNCSRIPQKVTFYVFFPDELDDYGFGISQVCPPTLPDDLGVLLREFLTNQQIQNDLLVVLDEQQDQVTQAMLSDFHWTVESSIGVIIEPGVVLTNGARLTVVRGDGEDGNGVGGDDVNYNYTLQTGFDDFGNVIAQSKQYFDAQGRLIQSQSKDLERGVVLASQTVYDRYGRAGAVSLPAPVRASSGGGPLSAQCPDYVDQVKPVQFGYVDKLLLNPSGNPYSADDIYEHRPVKDEVGSVGWYYSEQNQPSGDEQRDKLVEDQVATTKYPLMQTLYRGDGSGEVVAQTLPGDQWYETYQQTVPGPNGEDVERDRIRVVHTARSEVQPLDVSTRYDSDLIRTYFQARQTEVGVPDPFGDSYTPIDPYLRDGYYKRVSWDANGRRSVSYHNEADQQLISQYYGNESEPITESYSYYDDRGRLVGSRDPKKLVTMYKYDFRGRMLSMDEPDAGLTQYVYRRDGSIRFSQNAKQAQNKQYSYTHYDEAGRPTESGEWTPSDASESIQRLRTSKDLLEQRSSELPPGSTTDVVRTTYDVAVALPEGIAGRTGQFLMGKVSYSEKRDEAGAPLSRSWYSYDERGRVVWMVQDIAGLGVKTVDYTYNGQGNVRVVAYQQDQDDAFYHYYEYGADTRLKEVYTSTTKPKYELDEYTLKNQDQFARQASYEYYLHGPLKQVVLAGEKDSEGRIINELQATDYFYTVQGWLKAINNPNDASNPDNDVFAMQLDYFAEDYVKTGSGIVENAVATEDYSGNIQQQQWRTQTPQIANLPGNQVANAYRYQYDQRYQLQSATFGSMNSGSFTADASQSYRTTGLDYDENGNILGLQRRDKDGNLLHDFAGKYIYTEGTNQLASVTGYKSYTYNAIGQMTEEVSATGSQKLSYDVSGKVTQVRNENDQLIVQYQYDDRGFRVSKQSYESGALNKTTYYVRDASGSLMSTYEEEAGLTIAQTEVPVYGSSRLGLYQPSDGVLDFELKDHLGNVRSIISSQGGALNVKYYADYYSYGSILRSGGTPSRFGFQGEFAEDETQETGWSFFEARTYNATIGRWASTDPKRQFYSPYLAMGNNPISIVDPDGRDIIILNSSRSVLGGLGHVGLLIGNDSDGWRYISKNGTEKGWPLGKSYEPDLGDLAFVDGEGNDYRGTGLTASQVMLLVNERHLETNPEGERYDNYIRVEATTIQDELAYQAIIEPAKSFYNICGGSCLDVVQEALKATGKDFYNFQDFNPFPNDWFVNFGIYNNNRSYGRVPEAKTPMIIVEPIRDVEFLPE